MVTQQPHSCAYTCPPLACPETTAPYACPSMAAWSSLPHETECGCWDGSYPTVVPGKCTASAPSGEAAKYAGADRDHAGVRILPDGRRLRPAGSEWIFNETDQGGGLTTGVLAIPATTMVLTVDTGAGNHLVRLIETTSIGSGNPVKGLVSFAPPSTLNSEIAFTGPDLALVATNDGVVQALKVDTAAGTIARDDARSIKLPISMDAMGSPAPFYVAGVAISPDGKRLVVTGVREKKLLVYDLTPGTGYGTKLGQVDLGADETYQARFDPADATGSLVYVSLWSSAQVAEVNVSDPAAPKVTRKLAVEKDPQGMAFLDARWMVVANTFGESISLIDRTSGTIFRVPVEVDARLRGLDPSSLSYDAPNHRLYVALAGINAVGAYDVDLASSPPRISPLGRLPASWWPGGVAVLPSGAVVVASMRGHGGGGSLTPFTIGSSDISERMRGGVQLIPLPSVADLVDGEAKVASDLAVGSQPGYPAVSCPANVSDFPIPATNTEGPSKAIDHVFLIVRENKDFDALFGDLPGVEGKADLTLKKSPADMDSIWQNIRTLAKTFTVSDNYYTDAVYSTQGHVWTTYGRSNDFNERTWIVSGDSRSARPIPGGGVIDVGKPEDGSLFDWLGTNGIPYDILGEIVGGPKKTPQDHNPIDVRYPGGPFQNIGFNDLEKSCYVAGRARALCNLGNFTYLTLPNDHTFGVSDTHPSPETFCAVNDEATGMVIDAISHSPLWKSSLILVTEDDPSQGGEHIDSHRAPLVAISPWVKRGYVSKSHIDVASLHKIFAHVFGKPYSSFGVKSAALPFDMFTSTPDFTPYVYASRTWKLACGAGGTLAEKALQSSWDFSDVDEQPGLDAQVGRWMRGTQLSVLSPRQEEEMARRVRFTK
jgi:DNA-binding beta-propeller fold protein YncE